MWWLCLAPSIVGFALIVVSTLLTLVVIPVLYFAVNRRRLEPESPS